MRAGSEGTEPALFTTCVTPLYYLKDLLDNVFASSSVFVLFCPPTL